MQNIIEYENIYLLDMSDEFNDSCVLAVKMKFYDNSLK